MKREYRTPHSPIGNTLGKVTGPARDAAMYFEVIVSFRPHPQTNFYQCIHVITRRFRSRDYHVTFPRAVGRSILSLHDIVLVIVISRY